MPSNFKLTTGQWLIAAGSVLGFLLTFAPWFSVDCGTACAYFNISTSVNGTQSGLFGYLFFLAVLVTIALMVVRIFLTKQVKLPALPMEDWLIFTILGAVMIGSLIMCFLVNHDGVSISFGFMACLIGAVVVTVGGFMHKSDPQPASGAMSMNSGGGPGAQPPTWGGPPQGGGMPPTPPAPPAAPPQQPPYPPAAPPPGAG